VPLSGGPQDPDAGSGDPACTGPRRLAPPAAGPLSPSQGPAPCNQTSRGNPLAMPESLSRRWMALSEERAFIPPMPLLGLDLRWLPC
jgi:hypothetical protein